MNRQVSIRWDLYKAKVCNIAEFITGGDVGHVCGETEKFSAAVESEQPHVLHRYSLIPGVVGAALECF